MSNFDHPMITEYVAAMEGHSDPDKAREMAAYLKTDMPFYGVQKTTRRAVTRGFKKRFPVESRTAYEDLVRGFWELPRREDKYMAIEVARMHRRFIVLESLPLYRDLVVEGGWWDLVDDVAANLVGTVFREHRANVELTIRRWAQDQDLWLRRTALLSQLKHKEKTDAALLFDLCESMFGDNNFFIRKAIGWALRQYSYAAPGDVLAFVQEHRSSMSGLSVREGMKALRRQGYSLED